MPTTRKCPTPQKPAFRSELSAKLWAARAYTRQGSRQKPYRCPACRRWHVYTTNKRKDTP